MDKGITTYAGGEWTDAHEKASKHIGQLMDEAATVAQQFGLQMMGAHETSGSKYKMVVHGDPAFGINLMGDLEERLPLSLRVAALLNKLRNAQKNIK